MASPKICALCLNSESDWYLKVFSEDNKPLDIPGVVSKHLWFDLSEDTHPYMCTECWTSVHDFHLFYSKLATIHEQDVDMIVDQTGEYYYHSEEEYVETDHVREESTSNVEDGRPRRSSKIPLRYQTSPLFSKSLEEHVYDAHDNDNDLDYDNLKIEYLDDALPLDESKELENDEQSNNEHEQPEPIDDTMEEEPIKRRRGRPPKRKHEMDSSIESENHESQLGENITDNTTTPTTETPVKRGRGRPRKHRPGDTGASPTETAVAQKAVPKSRNFPPPPQMKARREKYMSETEVPEGESEPGDTSDFEERLKLQKKLNMDDFAFYEYQLKRETRDERIYKYVEEFICQHCEERVEFQKFADADRHYKLVHNEPGFIKCPKCEKRCCSTAMFVNHMETHEDPEKNKCKFCGKMTDSYVSLKKHMRVHQAELEENLPFPCTRCKRRFETEDLLERHEKLHVPKAYVKKDKGPDLQLLAFYKRIYCDICEEREPNSPSYQNFSELCEHMGKEHEKAAYLRCPICEKKNIYRPQLLTHIDMHENPEKYRCEVCKEIHPDLDKHMVKAHTPKTTESLEKKYKCDQCERMFNFKVNLKLHVDNVHGAKDIRCNICNKYYNYAAYRVHKRSAHKARTLMCELCPKMFRNTKSLQMHQSFHEGKMEYQNCTLCGKKIKIVSMSKHMKTVHADEEPVNCEMCGKTFRSMYHMKRHQRNTCAATVDSRSFKCEVCGKGFCTKLTMMEHMTTHTRNNQYQCAFCFKSFGYISNLYKHRKKAHPLEWQEVQARPEEGIATVIMVRN